MSESVIRIVINRMRDYVWVPTYPLEHDPSDYVEAAVDEVASWLEGATDARQFMPPSQEWPEDATWCAIQPNGCREFFEKEPFVETPYLESWGDGSILNCVDSWSDDPVPIGVDFRTLKVSRSDMERWEAER